MFKSMSSVLNPSLPNPTNLLPWSLLGNQLTFWKLVDNEKEPGILPVFPIRPVGTSWFKKKKKKKKRGSVFL